MEIFFVCEVGIKLFLLSIRDTTGVNLLFLSMTFLMYKGSNKTRIFKCYHCRKFELTLIISQFHSTQVAVLVRSWQSPLRHPTMYNITAKSDSRYIFCGSAHSFSLSPDPFTEFLNSLKERSIV